MKKGDFDLVAAIKEHGRSARKLKGPFKVPEWEANGQAFEYYYRESNQEEAALTNKYLDNPTEEGTAAYLCMKLLDENGDPWMVPANAIELIKQGHFSTMDRVAAQIYKAVDKAPAEATNEELGKS